VISHQRCVALGKLLIAVAQSCFEKPRSCIHILYIVNDVFHWLSFHSKLGTAFIEAASEWLVKVLSACAFGTSPKYQQRALELLDLWQKNNYFSTNIIQSLRQSATSTGASQDDQTTTRSSADKAPPEGKDAPWILPPTHGDPSTPFYDLPAANMIPLITPNSSRPIKPYRMKPLRLVPGPADKSLITVVEHLIKDVDRIYNASVVNDEDYTVPDIDMMGQEIVLDEMGERIGGDSYYGWSRSFCENMQKKLDGKGHAASRSDSQSPSQSRSRSPRKRRRSQTSSRSRSRSRDRYRSRSPQHHKPNYNQSRSPASRPSFRGGASGMHPIPTIPPVPMVGFPVPPPMIGPGDMVVPIPPPRPLGWQGPWPPLPPPGGFQMPPGNLPAGFIPPMPPGYGGMGGRGGFQGRGRDPRR
jgi:hypothetical protein